VEMEGRLYRRLSFRRARKYIAAVLSMEYSLF
jgi:hypothetical protein